LLAAISLLVKFLYLPFFCLNYPTSAIPLHVQNTRAKQFVLYDSECPLCTFQMKLLTWLDWGSRLELIPISDPRAAALAPNVTRDELLEAIHCVSTDGRIYRGARALRFVGLRMPLLVPLALFLWIPGVIWVAEKVYMWISRNRHLLSRLFGCKQACAILPARKRS
jgi:predicted DCC family thiol-disulfide oxidoreductase YuxK